MTSKGAVPPDNPFPGKLIFAYGLRNSFGFTFDPLTGKLWETENGPECNDEVNLEQAGENHAWGSSETCSTPPAPPANTNQDGPAPRILPLAYFTPTVLPMIAVANIWLFFYTPEYGLLEQITSAFGLPAHNWLGSKNSALAALMVVTVWKEAGFFMIFYLAALQQMSPALGEAAALEGAGRWYFFRRVTFPLLMPTTLFILINAVINSFRLVDHIVVMTKGGPDNTTALLLYYIYDVGFKFWDTGYAAALTMVLLALLATAAIVQFVVLEKRIHYR